MFDRIKKLAEARQMTIQELERELGFGNGTIGKWRTKQPKLPNVKKVADFFGVTIDSLTA